MEAPLRIVAGWLAFGALSACGAAPETGRAIRSPNGEVTLVVKRSDLGACCGSRVQVSGRVFGKQVENLAEISGSSDIRYQWIDPVTLSIVACNATEASFQSGYQNDDFTRRFILSVENERPEEDKDRVLCSSDRFKRMATL